jgi:hypothetical protein
MNKIIKKCMSILLMTALLLQQVGCVTMWLSDHTYKRPYTAYYQYHTNKVVSAYVDKSESYLTICIEGTLNIANKSPLSQIFALHIPITEEKLKKPPTGIQYSTNGKIPTVEIEHSAILPDCPEQPTEARTVVVENKDTLRKHHTPKELQKLRRLGFDPVQMNIPAPYPNIDTVYYVPLQQYTDNRLVKELVYATRPSMILSTPPLVTHVYTPDGIEKLRHPVALQESVPIFSPPPFSGQQFLILKTKGAEKSIPNDNYEYYALLPISITFDILLSPVYLVGVVGGIIFLVACSISSGRGCLRM